MSSWQAPPFTADATVRMGWIEEQIQEGEGWLMGQKAYKDLNNNFRIFDGVFNDKTKSNLITNELKYDIRKFVETLSDMREIGTLGSDAPQYKPFVQMENDLLKSIYLEGEFTYNLRKALQYATVVGRGYIWTKCKAGNYGFGERKIIFQPMGLMDVVPVQVPSSNDTQAAYINTYYEYMPIAEAHARFPLFASQLQPISRMRIASGLSGRRLDHAERFHYNAETRSFGDLYVEIRYTFIRDISINNEKLSAGKKIPMGDIGTSWFYEVPCVGTPVLGGYQNGQPFDRPATVQDALLYPNLRLMISNKGMATPMYDGPAFDWTGEMPAVQYDVDDYPWMGIGNSLVSDVGSIQTSIRKLERKMEQVILTSLNPPMGYDRTATGGPKIEHFDLFEEDVRAGVDGRPIDVLHSLLPESVAITAIHFEWSQYLSAKMGKQLGLEDIANLEQLKMNIGSDDAEKILEGIGPVGKGIAAGIERSNARVVNQLKTLIPQWYDTKRVISMIGPDKVTPQTYDYDPNTLIPSHTLQEYVNGAPPLMTPSKYSILERARMFAKNVRVTSVPSTLLRITQMQEQLKYIQLWRGQAPIAFSDVAKKLDIDNYGEVPGATGRERWINEKMDDILIQAKAMAEMEKLGLVPPPGAAGPGGAPSPGAGVGKASPVSGGSTGKPGRKPTAQKPPKIKKKGDGRVIISESG